MKILVLTKRQYMGKDLLDDAYGRFAEIPIALAARGHDVRGLCLSYRARAPGEFVTGTADAQVPWTSVNLTACPPFGLYRHWRAAHAGIRASRPDVIWACSDAFHIIIGAGLERSTGVPCVADLYDNFAGYRASGVPGVEPCYRAALKRTTAISCVSEPLRELLLDSYEVGATVQVLPNAANEVLFHARDRATCRAEFDLPARARIIGTAGAVSRTRGIGTLFDAFERLAGRDPDLRLVLAGPIDRGVRIPDHPRIAYLGNLDHARVPVLYGAMDAAVICNEPSAFGDYCFPQKYYEILACGIPVIAARVGALARLPGNPVNAFYEPGDAQSLGDAVERCLAVPGMVDASLVTWRDRAAELEPLLHYAAGHV